MKLGSIEDRLFRVVQAINQTVTVSVSEIHNRVFTDCFTLAGTAEEAMQAAEFERHGDIL